MGTSLQVVPAPDQAPAQPSDVRIHLLPTHQVNGHLDTLVRLAAEAFAGPPWRETEDDARALGTRLLDDVDRPGFVLALASWCGHPAGFAYGVRSLRLVTLAGTAPVSGPPPFELRELAVRPAAQGCGLGAGLHDAVLDASREGPRWLATHPGARAAVALYRCRGWRSIRLVPTCPGAGLRVLMHRPR